MTPKERNRERVKLWAAKNKEKIKGYHRNHRLKHPLSGMLKSTKARAKKLNLAFDLTEDSFVLPTHCPILGIELVKNQIGKSGPRYNSPSIDRFDPTKGYTKDNVWIISFKANAMKQNASIEELKRFSAWINTLEL